MMKLQLDKCINFEIGEETLKVRLPSVKDQMELKKLSKGIEEGSDEQVIIILDWLETLGFPKKYSERLGVKDLSTVIDELVGSKKN